MINKQIASTMKKISPLPNVCKPYSYVTAICHIFYPITRNFFLAAAIYML